MCVVSWSSGPGISSRDWYQDGNIRPDAPRNLVERESEIESIDIPVCVYFFVNSMFFVACFLQVDVFLVVLGLILVLFAALYHIMLVGETLEDDEWGSFKDSLWKVWGYAVGEIDDTAFPTTSSYFLFTAFALTIVIIMMVRISR